MNRVRAYQRRKAILRDAAAARSEGLTAAQAGLNRTSNPYRSADAPNESMEWQRGFDTTS